MRLDKYLAENGFSSRTKAARALEMGRVYRNGKVAKASDEVHDGDRIVIEEDPIGFVSEGGKKLQKALTDFSESVRGKVCADIGASTGGFTDCLLQNGASHVYAIDVGESQLDSRLAQDSRVTIMDRVNARYLSKADLPRLMEIVTIDVSFISLTHILPGVASLLTEGGKIFALVKPQFEWAGKGLDKHGIVKDATVRRSVLERIAHFACSLGLCPLRATCAPLRPRKNVEYVLLLEKNGLPDVDCAAIARMAEPLCGR